MTNAEFITHQARAWSEIREWAEEAQANPMILTQRGGSWDGPGASTEATEGLRRELPALLKELRVATMLDAPCGDWNWMRLVDLTGIEYTGWDVDPGRTERCRQRLVHSDFVSVDRPNAVFETINLLTVEEVPYFDLILCRDFLGHLTNEYIHMVLDKFRASGSQWLLASTYPDTDNAFEYDPDRWTWLGYMERPVNLEADPFSLTKAGAIEESVGPGGVLMEHRELALFQLVQP